MFVVTDDVYVEGFPIGRWSRFEQGALLCLSHSISQDACNGEDLESMPYTERERTLFNGTGRVWKAGRK